MNVLQIVRQYLIDNGYDGLCKDDCGCGLDILAPCSYDFSCCEPGYRVDGCSGECGMGCDFHIVPEKPTKDEKWKLG